MKITQLIKIKIYIKFTIYYLRKDKLVKYKNKINE